MLLLRQLAARCEAVDHDPHQRLVSSRALTSRDPTRLSHPNVIAVYDVGIHEDGIWVAMELVEGARLYHWLTEEERSLAEILEVFAAAGRGLDAAHSAGLIHRDYKPSNVIVSDDGRPRLLDFGLVRTTIYRDDPGPGGGWLANALVTGADLALTRFGHQRASV